jgi:putative sigma-54 modulation protein
VQIHLTGRHVELTDDVRDYIHSKMARLPRFYDRVHAVEVVLDHESDRSGHVRPGRPYCR